MCLSTQGRKRGIIIKRKLTVNFACVYFLYSVLIKTSCYSNCGKRLRQLHLAKDTLLVKKSVKMT